MFTITVFDILLFKARSMLMSRTASHRKRKGLSKESGVICVLFKFLVLCNDMQNVFRGEAAPRRAKYNKVLA